MTSAESRPGQMGIARLRKALRIPAGLSETWAAGQVNTPPGCEPEQVDRTWGADLFRDSGYFFRLLKLMARIP